MKKKNIKVVRKSIVAKFGILRGEYFNYQNLTAKRPGIGISPMDIIKLIGKKSKNNYLKNELLNKSELGNNKYKNR